MIFNINEVYFGKSKELEEIETKLGKFRWKYYSKILPAVKARYDDDLAEINRLFEKYFGFGNFSLNIIYRDIYNAYTIPISYRYDIEKDSNPLIVDKNHYKFNPKYKYSCIVAIYSGLLFDDRFSDEEILAIILHEIGHNFYFCLYGSPSGVFTKLKSAMALTNENIACVNNGGSPKSATVNSTQTTLEDLSIIIGYFANAFISSWLTGIQYATLGIIDLLSAAISHPLYKLIYKNKNAKLTAKRMYNDEKTADNFATIHGYGAPLMTALRKMENSYEKSIKKDNLFNIKLLAPIKNLNLLAAGVLLAPFEEHPATIIRAKDQLAMLENDLKDASIDPKMKKEIKENIKVCKDSLESLNRDIEMSHKSLAFGPLYKRLLFKELNIKEEQDKEYDTEDRFSKLNKTYNKLNKKK